jgi:hypothetical protein
MRAQANDIHHDSLSGLIEDEVLTRNADCQLRQAIPGRLKVGSAAKPNSGSIRVFSEKVKCYLHVALHNYMSRSPAILINVQFHGAYYRRRSCKDNVTVPRLCADKSYN